MTTFDLVITILIFIALIGFASIPVLISDDNDRSWIWQKRKKKTDATSISSADQ